ncbi:leucyl aminopeptidase family protein, partial [Escherichia coli]|nr:leucyl aminopeptidase family protein [Escherichia coli]
MPLCFAPDSETALPLYLVAQDGFDQWLTQLPAAQAAWLRATGFDAAIGAVALLPDGQGGIAGAVAGYGTTDARARGRFHLAAARSRLPKGDWRLVSDLTGDDLAQEALGWLMAGYRFDRYRNQSAPKAQLVAPEGVDAARLEILAAGEALTRDLINTPAADMGPEALEDAVFALAAQHGAQV